MKKNIINNTITSTINNGQKVNGNCNAVFCISNGSVFISQKEAAEKCNVNPAGISLVCRGLQRCVKGLRFCLVTDIPSHIVEISQTMSKMHSDNMEKEKALAEMEQTHKEVEKDAQMFLKVMSDKLKAIAG